VVKCAVDNSLITLPSGVRLRDPEDYSTLRSDIFAAAKEEFASSFPRSYGGVRLEVADVDYEGPESFTPSEQHKAKMEDGYLYRKLRGTLRLVDEKTGSLLDEKRTSLMRVPWLSEHGTFLHNGNNYSMAMQARLMPGAYTRRKSNGLTETQFNVRPGSGRAFRLAFNPETVQYQLAVGPGGSSQLHFYSLLKDMGVEDDELQQTWGDDVLNANRSKYDSRVLARAYKNLVPAWKQTEGLDRVGQADAVKAALEAAQVSTAVARRTLPNLFDRTKAAEWRAKFLGREAGEELFEKHAALLEFAPDLTPAGTLVARLEDDFEALSTTRFMTTSRWEKSKQASEAPPVELGERKKTYWICPHCKEEIHEKGSRPKYGADRPAGMPWVEIHSSCGGEFTPPPASKEEVEALERWKSGFVAAPPAIQWQPMPVYDWDGTLINRLSGDASDYMEGLKSVDLTELGRRLQGETLDVVTARPDLFHPRIRETAERLGLNIGDIYHDVDKTDTVRKLMRPLVDDTPEVVERLRLNLGPESAELYTAEDAPDAPQEKQASDATSEKQRQQARKDTVQPKSFEQAEAGNYSKGKFTWNGIRIRLENPKGTTRKGLRPDGTTAWESDMKDDYGYILGTTGVDGDELDVFIGPDLTAEMVYVVDQIDQRTGEFDEHKCVLGAGNKDKAKSIYQKAYQKGWKVGDITAFTIDQFKAWALAGRKRKPAADLQSVKMAGLEFRPDLSGDDMKEAYEAVYGHVGPRLASMEKWPSEWLPPGSDSLGWISWYRKYADGTRTDDDDRQIARWRKFKARELPKFLKNPTPRRAFSLRYWAIDPIKHLDEDAGRKMESEMKVYREREGARWLREKTAGFSGDDLVLLIEFLNREHGAGLPVVGDVETLEAAVLAWLGLSNPAASALSAASKLYPTTV